MGQRHPILGHGYSAFWVQGRPEAERYWAEFYIDIRSSFHFHSTFVQVFVDLGLAGIAMVVLLLLANIASGFAAAVRYGMRPEIFLALMFAFAFLIRAFVEVDFFVGPFGMGALLFYSLLPRLADMRRAGGRSTNATLH
jgi:exopolysaccharide production protein ExoQ